MCAILCMYVCMPHACMVLVEVKGGHPIRGDWSDRGLRAAMWVMGIEPGISVRAPGALTH